ncbi:uncharacterized protein AMSG_05431 [Thecamonas trahens ATCC 50062]|uniref:Tyrosine-protein kinase ephrin type A/B receptor-like domain-containing protein n=1 Tax=Thecamonas trahens ATCC 50062 TaxID=461836 RepID=A0A0L0DBD6_THETB|nr:hypothetical protein AMSG_05431 [Thecamonas trahens ATCC 50062]KNC49426.1 hypothetical protein AMSG_05431 [Thecamonas trahens ATCC 50062]|eukprot:XP_013757849.1 hypothetical protein AMSG_05431 [Thecamonas trahens ATCC 50062]
MLAKRLVLVATLLLATAAVLPQPGACSFATIDAVLATAGGVVGSVKFPRPRPSFANISSAPGYVSMFMPPTPLNQVPYWAPYARVLKYVHSAPRVIFTNKAGVMIQITDSYEKGYCPLPAGGSHGDTKLRAVFTAYTPGTAFGLDSEYLNCGSYQEAGYSIVGHIGDHNIATLGNSSITIAAAVPNHTGVRLHTRTSPGTWEVADPLWYITPANGIGMVEMEDGYFFALTTQTPNVECKVYATPPEGVWPPGAAVATTSCGYSSTGQLTPIVSVKSQDPSDNYYAMFAYDKGTKTLVLFIIEQVSGANVVVTARDPAQYWSPAGAITMIGSSRIVALDPGGYVLAWVHPGHPDDDGGSGVIARVFRSDGEPLTDEFVVGKGVIDTGNDEDDVAVFVEDGFLAFGVTFLSDAGVAKHYVASFSLDVSGFDWNSQTNVVLRTSPLADMPVPPSMTMDATALRAGTRVPHRFAPGLFSAFETAIMYRVHYETYLGYTHVALSRDRIVLDPVRCSELGAPAFNLECLAAALVAPAVNDLPAINHGFHIRLPAGTWTGCPPQGVTIPFALTLAGDGQGATVVDCAGAGRAFVFNGTGLAPHAELAGSVVLADMTIKNGWVAAAVPAAGSIVAGGCVAVIDFAGTGVWVHVQDATLSNCTVTSEATEQVPRSSTSNADVEYDVTLVGGGLGVVNTADVWVSRVRIELCSVTMPYLPVFASSLLRTPRMYGGGLGVMFDQMVGASYDAAVDDPRSRGVVIEDFTAVGNLVMTPSSRAIGGGGGVAVAALPVDIGLIIVASVAADGNSVSGSQLAGGGMLFADTALRPASTFIGPSLALSNNKAPSGGGLALSAVTSTSIELIELLGLELRGNIAVGVGGGLSVASPSSADARVVIREAVAAGNTAGTSGGGTGIAGLALVIVSNSTFDGNHAMRGGGLAVADQAILQLDNTQVVGNTAEYGGGLAAEGTTCLLQSGCAITGNVAGRYGGGALVSSGTLTYAAGDVAVSGNRAEIAGGGVFECLLSQACGKTLASPCNGVGSGDVSSMTYVESISPADAAAQTTLNTPSNLASDPVALVKTDGTTTGMVATISSGQAPFPSLAVHAVDSYGAMSLFAYNARLVAVADAGGAAALALAPAYIPVGSAEQMSVATATCSSDAGGRCELSQARVLALTVDDLSTSYVVGVEMEDMTCVRLATPMVVAIMPCKENEITVVSSTVTCEVACTAGEYLDGEQCLACKPGTFRSDARHQLELCSTCPGGMFSFGGAAACRVCPIGGDCSDPTRILAAPGFWYPYGNASAQLDMGAFLACEPAEACPGGAGYTQCAPGYANNFACSKCNMVSVVIVIALVAVGIAVGIVVITLVVRAQRMKTQRRVRSLSVVPQIVKTAINTAQTLAVVFALRAQTSKLLATTAAQALTFSALSMDIVPIRCLSNLSVYQSFVATMLVPIAIVFVSGLCSLVASPTQPALAARQAATIAAVGFFLAYPAVARSAMSMLACRAFSLRSGLWLADDLDIQCFVGSHAVYAGVAVVAIVVYVVGAPLALLLALRAAPADRYSRWSFFAGQYRSRVWFWEWAILIRKVGMTALAVYSRRAVEQLVMTSLVLIVVLGAQLYAQPLILRKLNNAEAGGVAVCIYVVLATFAIFSRDRTDADVESAGRATPARSQFVSFLEYSALAAIAGYFLWLFSLVFTMRRAASAIVPLSYSQSEPGSESGDNVSATELVVVTSRGKTVVSGSSSSSDSKDLDTYSGAMPMSSSSTLSTL